MEPIVSPITYGLAKLWYAIGGSFGSAAMGTVWQPAALNGYGKFAKGLIIGGIGAGAPVVFGGLIAMYLGLDPHSADVGMAIGASVGILALGFIVFLANFFKNRETSDVLEVAAEIRGAVKGQSKPVAKKPAAKKAVRKTSK